ncbi:DMT family transporter [Lentibacter algarum]|uniref:DMT family transporter n=1 Tax=Lentibacter algarum TaxID=576131 RepID=UPI002490319A|nr:DMT family transporter [Lentibacter algarum]
MGLATKGLLITLAGVLVISPDVLLVRLIDADTLTKLFWRGLLSGLVILGVWGAFLQRRPMRDVVRVGRSGWALAAIFALGTFCFLYAVEKTQAANVLLISATSPVIAALISIVVLKEHVDRLTWVGIGGALLGVFVIAAGSAGGEGNLIGDMAAFGGAVSLALTFSIARAQKNISMVPAMGLSGLLTALAAGLLAPSLVVPIDSWVLMLALGAVVVPLGFGLLTTGPQYIGAAEVSLILLLEALLGPVLVWWVIGEFPGQAALWGGSIILSALAGVNLIRLKGAAGG